MLSHTHSLQEKKEEGENTACKRLSPEKEWTRAGTGWYWHETTCSDLRIWIILNHHQCLFHLITWSKIVTPPNWIKLDNLECWFILICHLLTYKSHDLGSIWTDRMRAAGSGLVLVRDQGNRTVPAIGNPWGWYSGDVEDCRGCNCYNWPINHSIHYESCHF